MGKQWAKREVHRNEVAEALAKAVAWARGNPQTAAGAAGAVVLAAALAGFYFYRSSASAEQSWERLAVAQTYAMQGQPDAAIQQLKAIEDEYPGTTAADYAALFAGDILFRLGRHVEAAATYGRVASRQGASPIIPMAQSDLGLAQEAAGNFKAASETAQRFLDTYQDHFLAPQVHASLARCLEALGQRDRARATLERMALLYPQTYWEKWAQDQLRS